MAEDSRVSPHETLRAELVERVDNAIVRMNGDPDPLAFQDWDHDDVARAAVGAVLPIIARVRATDQALTAKALNLAERCIDGLAQVSMDTPKDKALHAKVVEVMRENLRLLQAALAGDPEEG